MPQCFEVRVGGGVSSVLVLEVQIRTVNEDVVSKNRHHEWFLSLAGVTK
jgi:hypothetical protein